jgi:hypothetical protein
MVGVLEKIGEVFRLTCEQLAVLVWLTVPRGDLVRSLGQLAACGE